MANGDTSACPGLAAAILSICVIRSRSAPVLAQTSTVVIPALQDFLARVLNRTCKSNCSGCSTTVMSVHDSQGTNSSCTTRSGIGPHTGLSGTDADAFYMAGALLHLMLPYTSSGQAEVLEQVMLTVLGMLLRLLDTPEHLEHLLPVSMALTLVGSSLKTSAKLQDVVASKGVVGKVCLETAFFCTRAILFCHLTASGVLLFMTSSSPFIPCLFRLCSLP
jgi:hypothetical protein